MVNFIIAFAYHFCLTLPTAYTKPDQSLLSALCTVYVEMSRDPEQQNGHVLKCRSAVLADAGEDGDREVGWMMF